MKVPGSARLVGLLLIAGAFAALVVISLGSSLVYYVTPSELATSSRTGSVRLYGVVEPGSVRWDGSSSTVSFTVTDGSTTVAVQSRSLPTGLFREGIGVVLAGEASGNGVFFADEILVKHSEVYAPLEPGQTLPPGLLETIREGAP